VIQWPVIRTATGRDTQGSAGADYDHRSHR